MSPPFDRRIVVLSKALLAIDSLRQYGLIAGGPEINAERCKDAIAWGEEQGFEFTQEEINRAAVGFFQEWNTLKASA